MILEQAKLEMYQQGYIMQEAQNKSQQTDVWSSFNNINLTNQKWIQSNDIIEDKTNLLKLFKI